MTDNRVIKALPKADRIRLLAVCQTVELRQAEVLSQRGVPQQFLYFPIDCVLALMAQVDDHPPLAVALVGAEGTLGAPALLWPVVNAAMPPPASPLLAQVQVAGSAWQLNGTDLGPLLADSIALRRQLGRQVLRLLAMLASAAACAHFHQIGPRLARWLLLCQDRAQADSFQLTQAQLAVLLGVRRVGITVAAGGLQRDGLIGYHRGRLSVLNRTGLEAAACSCHATDLADEATAIG